MPSNRKPHDKNVKGPFYVVDGCCTACGVPDLVAPALFGEDEHRHCFVKRQPETSEELESMLLVVVAQELGCVRYRGRELDIMRRLVDAGEAEHCDALPRNLKPTLRDHASFVVMNDDPWTCRTLLEAFQRYLAAQSTPFTVTPIVEDETGTWLTASWVADRFQRVEIRASSMPGTWVVSHHGPLRFSETLHGWLASEPSFGEIRWQTRAQLEANGPWQRTPW